MHAVGKLGYVEFYYGVDGEQVATAVLYHRADDASVPIQSAEDFQRRLDWDKGRFQEIKQWLDAHLPKMVDLGVVELMDHTPTPIHLGPGKDYLATVVVESPTMFSLTLVADTPNAEDRDKSAIWRTIFRPNQPVSFSVDGSFYRLTPKLKPKPKTFDLGVVEVLANVPTLLDVGPGRKCIMTAHERNGGGISIRLEIQTPKYSTEIQTWVANPGEALSFPVDGQIFSLKPRINDKPS
jgi:hypothetical protein